MNVDPSVNMDFEETRTYTIQRSSHDSPTAMSITSLIDGDEHQKGTPSRSRGDVPVFKHIYHAYQRHVLWLLVTTMTVLG